MGKRAARQERLVEEEPQWGVRWMEECHHGCRVLGNLSSIS